VNNDHFSAVYVHEKLVAAFNPFQLKSVMSKALYDLSTIQLYTLIHTYMHEKVKEC